MILTGEQIVELEKIAQQNDGHCDRCYHTIKIYHYRINVSQAIFLRAMARKINYGDGVNDVDVSTLTISYSVRTQITKMRLHGLVARVKDGKGAQIANRWLITKKGWDFLAGKPTLAKVTVFNNQVLGHDDELTTLRAVLGGAIDKPEKWEEEAITEPEASTYEDVRTPKKKMGVKAVYRGHNSRLGLDTGRIYDLAIQRLVVGAPVFILSPALITYKDIAAFQREWRVV